MSRRQKLLRQIRKNPKNVRFEDLDRLLRLCGFEERHAGGSHYTYKHKGCRVILTVPRHKSIGEVYVKKALTIIEECGEGAEEEEAT